MVNKIRARCLTMNLKIRCNQSHRNEFSFVIYSLQGFHRAPFRSDVYTYLSQIRVDYRFEWAYGFTTQPSGPFRWWYSALVLRCYTIASLTSKKTLSGSFTARLCVPIPIQRGIEGSETGLKVIHLINGFKRLPRRYNL